MTDLKALSPVEPIHDPLFNEKQLSVFIKRDDQIHPYISGNKWRKLKYILKKAESENKDHLVTFGGAWSNHILATACAAARSGFKSTGIIRGEPVDNPLLTLSEIFGMDLIFTDRENYKDKRSLFENYFSDNEKALFIDEGGAGEEAVWGCSELISELDQEYDHIFCACGTGTTLSGIINGISLAGLKTRAHGVPVLKSADFLKAEIEAYLLKDSIYDFHTDYHFGGYAKVNAELIRFIKEFAASTGILLDPVYTGKLVFAVQDLTMKDHFKPGSSILIIHTGGLFGLLGMTEAFNEIF